MRRPILQDPLARSAMWSRNIALFALAVAVIGVLLSRKGLNSQAALAIEASALGFAGLAIFFAFVAMAVIWVKGFRGLGLALGGLFLSALLLAYPAYVVVEARTAPTLVDVATDTADPPIFLQTPTALTARHASTPSRTMAPADISLQKKLYPDLQTLTLDAEVGDVLDIVHKLLKKRHWTITDQVEPVNFATGRIDVVVKQGVMGFPADLAIRIRGLGQHTQVDIRSVLRSAWQEQPGANAARVESLASDIEDAVDRS